MQAWYSYADFPSPKENGQAKILSANVPSFQPRPHRLDGPLFIGELAGFQLRVDQIAVERKLEATAATGDQLQILDFLLVGGQQLGRQTDGLRFVISHRAVFQFHIHDTLLGRGPFRQHLLAVGLWHVYLILYARRGAGAMNEGFPPTVIVRHSNENPRKCSILPLRGKPGIIILGYPVKDPPDLASYVRLAADAPELSPGDAASGLLL